MSILNKLTIALILTAAAIAPPHTMARELSKKEKKQIEKAEKARRDSAEHCLALAAIADTAFVLKCDKITFQPSSISTYSLDPQLNFVMVNGQEAVVQTATNGTWQGFNGYGGFTLTGKANGYKTECSKKGETRVKYALHGSRGTAWIDLLLYKDSGKAVATINPPEVSGSLVMRGILTPILQPADIVNP